MPAVFGATDSAARCLTCASSTPTHPLQDQLLWPANSSNTRRRSGDNTSNEFGTSKEHLLYHWSSPFLEEWPEPPCWPSSGWQACSPRNWAWATLQRWMSCGVVYRLRFCVRPSLLSVDHAGGFLAPTSSLRLHLLRQGWRPRAVLTTLSRYFSLFPPLYLSRDLCLLVSFFTFFRRITGGAIVLVIEQA